MDSGTNFEASRLWRNWLVIVALYAIYVIIHHRFVSLGVTPLRTDPCDGVNAYAFFTIAVVATGFLLQLFGGRDKSSAWRYLYIVRSQQAVFLAVFINLLAAIVALLRDSASWIAIVPAKRLFVAVCSLAVVTLSALLLILMSQRSRIFLFPSTWTRTVFPTAAATLALAFCPQWPTYNASATAHLLTVAVGAAAVLIPIRLYLPLIVLKGSEAQHHTAASGQPWRWTLLACGAAVALPGYYTHVPLILTEIAEVSVVYGILGGSLGALKG